MTNGELIVAVIMFILAGICIFISICQFADKGVPINNAYLYASKQERKQMDFKPYFRQSGIVFSILATVFLINGLAMALQNYKLQLLEIPLIVSALIYAIVSSVKIEKHTSR